MIYCGVPVGGYQKITLTDWPGKLATTLFTAGCRWSCAYCYNRELSEGEFTKTVEELEQELLALRHLGMTDGVVISGGEPTEHDGLVDLLIRLKYLGIPGVGLHTNGSRPHMLRRLLGARLINWVGIDVKCPASDYANLTGDPLAFVKLADSVKILLSNNCPFEARSVVSDPEPDYLTSLQETAEELGLDKLTLRAELAEGGSISTLCRSQVPAFYTLP